MATKTLEPAKNKVPKNVTKADAERALAWHVVSKGLPRGPVVRLLKAKKVDPQLIEKLSAALVPYGNT